MESNGCAYPGQNVPRVQYGTDSTSDHSLAVIRCRAIKPADVDAQTIEAWFHLSENALHANAFLSPYFILPAAKYLDPTAEIILVLAERISNHTIQLVGVGAFDERTANRLIPFRHLIAYRSCHSFSSGLLLDQNHAEPAMRALFDFFLQRKSTWQGIGFYEFPARSRTFELMEKIARERNLRWFEIDKIDRPILVPAEAGQEHLNEHLADRQKSLKRGMKNLLKHGTVSWRVVDGSLPFEDSINCFIKLEHMGWKGAQGGSLQSRAGHSDFFRTMATSFLNQRRAFFTELLVDEKIISSTFNLISANIGFAFKIAWDPAYEKCSPGLLNELELMRSSPKYWPHLAYIDSCAAPGSYLEKLWTARKTMVTGVIATTKSAHLLARIREYLQRAKRYLTKWRESLTISLLLDLSVNFWDAIDFLQPGIG